MITNINKIIINKINNNKYTNNFYKEIKLKKT
jgi:hypothetical protein